MSGADSMYGARAGPLRNTPFVLSLMPKLRWLFLGLLRQESGACINQRLWNGHHWNLGLFGGCESGVSWGNCLVLRPRGPLPPDDMP
jgi:hypothetical protein